MCRLKSSGLLALVVFLSSSGLEVVGPPNSRGPGEVAKATARQRFLAAAGLERREGGGCFDDGGIGPGDDGPGRNETYLGALVNKCCAWNSYFDVDELVCVPRADGREGLSEWNFSVGGERSNHAFVERIPECGPESVLQVRVASDISVGAWGLRIEGDEEVISAEYCVDEHPGCVRGAVVLVCRDARVFCKNRTCYRKCCPLGHGYTASGRKCQKSNEPFRPEFRDLSDLSRVEPPRVGEWGIHLKDACGSRGKYLLERDAGEASYLGLDGTLLVPALEKRFPGSEFCVESVSMGNRSGVESFLCFSKSGARFENSPLQFFLLSLGFIISCVFLLATFLVCLCSQKPRNLYEKTLMCYVACLFAAYLCLAVVELESGELDGNLCTIMGHVLLFSFLAAFFWLNVISFDVWKTFRQNRTVVNRSKTDEGKLQFLFYSLYAWTLPSAITSVCAYANGAQDLLCEAIRPDIGVENCWFSKKTKGIYVFFIAPISLLVALNTVFYVQTALKIWKVKSDVKKMESQKANKFSANRARFVINGKLFVVMGIAWSLEIISFFAPHPIWYVTDTANALHGVFVFAVFVLKKKVLRQVSERLRNSLDRIRQIATTGMVNRFERKNRRDPKTEGKTRAA